MNTYLTIALIGLGATIAFTLFLYLIRALKIADTDMLSVIGTLVTRSPNASARSIGLGIHLVAGVVFAFIYLSLAAAMGFEPGRDFIYFGMVIGLIHGVVFSIVMTILVAEHHPIARFREKGFTVVAAHGLGHVFYGFLIGVMATLMNPHLEHLRFFGAGLT